MVAHHTKHHDDGSTQNRWSFHPHFIATLSKLVVAKTWAKSSLKSSHILHNATTGIVPSLPWFPTTTYKAKYPIFVIAPSAHSNSPHGYRKHKWVSEWSSTWCPFLAPSLFPGPIIYVAHVFYKFRSQFPPSPRPPSPRWVMMSWAGPSRGRGRKIRSPYSLSSACGAPWIGDLPWDPPQRGKREGNRSWVILTYCPTFQVISVDKSPPGGMAMPSAAFPFT